MIRRTIVRLIIVSLALFPIGAGAEERARVPDPAEGVHRADLVMGTLVATAVEPAPRVVATAPEPLPQAPSPGGPSSPSGKLHPRLLEWSEKPAPGQTVPVVICFKQSLTIPRFPSLDRRLPLDAPENQEVLAEAALLIRGLADQRGAGLTQRRQEFAGRYGVHVTGSFWLIDGIVAEMPIEKVPELALRNDVQSIIPVDSGEPPPQDTDPSNNVDKARAQIGSDAYYKLGLAGGHIALLDSGVRSTHRQLAVPKGATARIAFQGDCIHGDARCKKTFRGGFNPEDDCSGHGTASAAILTGNETAGAAFRGVTDFAVESFKVYPSKFSPAGLCNGGLDAGAAIRGFEAAVAARNEVIVAQVAQTRGLDSLDGCISMAANAAFDAGAVVVAANGNRGSGERTVTEPASAARVLGVGNFDVKDGSAIKGQSRGPTTDGRIKPDIQAPTKTETASISCHPRPCTLSDVGLEVFSGTSGAVPYAGGAAALLRSFAAHVMKTKNVDPGLVYALMILSGQNLDFDNVKGAGPLQLPIDGTLRWGAVQVKHGETLEIPIDFPSPQGHLDAALWWPEEGVAAVHNNIDLLIVDRAGVVQTKSASEPGVFERARFQGPLRDTWKIQIQGTSVRSTSPPHQKVYFAIWNRATPP